MFKQQQRGFTLIEILIVFAMSIVALTIVVLVVLSAFRSTDTAQSAATARGHMNSLGFDVVGAQCAGMDSDGDGYVSCSVSTCNDARDAAGKCPQLQLHPIECSYWKRGCRATPLVRNNH